MLDRVVDFRRAKAASIALLTLAKNEERAAAEEGITEQQRERHLNTAHAARRALKK